jgi:hypothetical protein
MLHQKGTRMPSTFKAQVQYQDWEGTAAADEHQGREFEDFLESKQLIGQHETLIAVSLAVIEGCVCVHANVVDRRDFDSAKALVEHEDPIPTRRIDLDMTLQEFLSRFKRFEVVLTWNRLGLTGRAYGEQS